MKEPDSRLRLPDIPPILDKEVYIDNPTYSAKIEEGWDFSNNDSWYGNDILDTNDDNISFQTEAY